MKLNNKQLIAAAKCEKSKANKLLLENMGLIYKIAAEINVPGANKEDLVMAGCIKFLEIIDDYDEEKCPYISVYVWHPVKDAMYQSCTTLNKDLFQFSTNSAKAKDYLSCKNGRTPSNKEIAEFMDIKESTYEKRMNKIYSHNTISLDQPCGTSDDSEENSLLDMNLGVENPYIAESILIEEDKKYIKLAWAELSKEDQDILNVRYLINGNGMSLREAAEYLGINRESIRTRALEAKAHFQENLEKYGICA